MSLDIKTVAGQTTTTKQAMKIDFSIRLSPDGLRPWRSTTLERVLLIAMQPNSSEYIKIHHETTVSRVLLTQKQSEDGRFPNTSQELHNDTAADDAERNTVIRSLFLSIFSLTLRRFERAVIDMFSIAFL